ncbi:uncharacterized protein At5g08430-like isoform X2 [Durio zibethinus]|uniref:Uncharacterized protein At5g08430-like isoform X2 n=1 Tax=Durio zibethinus TaxID=66656 RepID=A0A6P5YKZ5_DURZI|nr:uncharacterized protein At5g08430-like isoform X2 [Durio zibethinus]
MDAKAVPVFWLEEYSGNPLTPASLKRKAKSKKLEFVHWGSKPLIEFLESIGIDTTKQISQHDVTDIIGKYVNDSNLLHPAKKKRILCDERLYSIFGRKTISRIKVYDLLETHYAENQDAWDDDFFFSSDEENLGEEQKGLSLERKAYQKKKVFETPKSCFAAIVPDNIKLVYLKRSLVKDLLKDFESFESKVVGSFVRIKSDPNNFLQKNSHQLVLVKGMKYSGNNDTNIDILLWVSNFVKDVSISMLSEDNFSQEECEDLHQRVKNGLLKRPTVMELEAKARILHADITKHLIAAELTLLPKLIDRANEKGWRKEMFEYMEKRELLQTPDEQSRLLLEVPNVIADEIELETAPQNGKHENAGSQISTVRGTSKILSVPASNGKLSTLMPLTTESVHWHDVHKRLTQPREGNDESAQLVNGPEKNGSIDKQSFVKIFNTQVIDLSDDEEQKDLNEVQAHEDVNSLMWHYADPQGDLQGPFSLKSLKAWMDADYFPNDFKVWKTGQNIDKAVLLTDILGRMFPI